MDHRVYCGRAGLFIVSSKDRYYYSRGVPIDNWIKNHYNIYDSYYDFYDIHLYIGKPITANSYIKNYKLIINKGYASKNIKVFIVDTDIKIKCKNKNQIASAVERICKLSEFI